MTFDAKNKSRFELAKKALIVGEPKLTEKDGDYNPLMRGAISHIFGPYCMQQSELSEEEFLVKVVM